MKLPMTSRKFMLHLVSKYGWVDAHEICKADRDRNAPGTASYAFLNATAKEFEKSRTVGILQP